MQALHDLKDKDLQGLAPEANVPIMVYNNPATANLEIKPELVARLSRIDNCEYIKESTLEVTRVRALGTNEYFDCMRAREIIEGEASAIDTAKALMVGTESGRFEDLVAVLVAGQPFKPARVKTLIAVPTTAGTGSEVTPWAP